MSSLTTKEREILDAKNFLFISTLNKDGSSQVSPVWVEIDGDLVVVNTDRTRLKARNMERDARVGLAALSQSNPYDAISLRGKVIEMTDEGADAHIDRLSQKYLGKSYPYHKADEKRVIVKIQKI